MQFDQILFQELDSFFFVITFLAIYFAFFLSLHFSEVGLEAIFLWKLFSNIALIGIFITIALLFVRSTLYQTIPFYLMILTLNIIIIYIWRQQPEELLNRIGLIFSSLLSVFWLILILFHQLKFFEGFQGGEFLGLNFGEGPTFTRIIQTLFSTRNYPPEEIISLGFFASFTLISFIKYITNSFSSYTYLQGRPSSLPFGLYGIFGIVWIILLLLKLPIGIMLLLGILAMFSSLIISFLNYIRSKHVFFLLMATTKFYLAILIIFMLFVSSNLHLIFILFMGLVLITLIIVPDEGIIDIDL